MKPVSLPLSQQKCANCRYWRGGSGGNGKCHRHAPIPHKVGTFPSMHEWLPTEYRDWCGEWVPREEE